MVFSMTQKSKTGCPLGKEKFPFKQAMTGHGLISDIENTGSRENGLDTSQLVRKRYKLVKSIPEAFWTILLRNYELTRC